MSTDDHRWTLILAAGSGTRLTSLTGDGNGGAVPKQYCSLRGGASLLEETYARARAFSAARHTVTVVAAEHRRYFSPLLGALGGDNVVAQPANRGTAMGILLGVSAIVARDPAALVTILPSDHHIAHEDVLRRALSRAMTIAAADETRRAIHFLGLAPEQADPELGYIVRGDAALDGSFAIAQFVEKPSREIAQRLIARQALWNSFIIVARAGALTALVAERFPREAAAFTDVWLAAPERSRRALDALYARLPEADFSRDVVARAAAPLKVVPVPHCGWSDLGTPSRVAECLARLGPRAPARASRHLNLAAAHAQRAGAQAEALRTA